MERRIRYEVLQDETSDDSSSELGHTNPAIPATMVLVEETSQQQSATEPPPAASEQSQEEMAATGEVPTNTDTDNSAAFKIPEPPSYNIATALPTYEEAERSKLEQEQARVRDEEEQPVSGNSNSQQPAVDPLLGTDGMFLLTFMVSFIFNWIGLLASQCLSQSVAGRLGSMAGFGLSLVKWVAILKHNNWINGVADSDSWLWWLLILLGFLIFFRGCTQYVRIKHQWNRLSQNVRNNIFYYF